MPANAVPTSEGNVEDSPVAKERIGEGFPAKAMIIGIVLLVVV
jgi:hypothetical protein